MTTDQTNASHGPNARRALKTAAFIAVVGPLMGTLVVLLIPFASTALQATAETFSLSGLSEIAGLLLFVGLFGYVFGGLPALTAAAILGRIVWRHGTFGYGMAMLVGALSGLVGGLLLTYATQSESGFSPGFAVFPIPFSAASAMICRWLMGFFGVLPRAGNVSLAKH